MFFFAINEDLIKVQEVQWITDIFVSIVRQTEQTLILSD
jgi:hypothetical protein